MKKVLFAMLMLLPMVASAYDVEIDGIYYNVVAKAKVAEVTYGENKYSGVVNIPSTITYNGIECTVNSLGPGAFTECYDLTSLRINEGVETIKSGCLQVVRKLESVYIPKSLKSIADWNFTYTGEVNVYIDDLESWCSIQFQSNPLGMSGHLFLNGEELHDLVLPSTLSTISDMAFSGCQSIKKLTIPDGINSIGSSAFNGCSQLETIIFPSNQLILNDNSFAYCSSIKSLELPPNVLLSGYSIFNSCTSLENVVLPNTMTSINGWLFAECTSLKDLSFLHTNIKEIGESAFMGCTGLKEIELPNGVQKIKDYAFGNCTEVKTIKLPASISEIKWYAFSSCKNLSDVYCYATYVPVAEENVFFDSYIEYSTLYVPESAINYYKTSIPWSSFGTITTMSGETPQPQKCTTPTIAYTNGKITFTCETEGAECVATISDADIKTHYGNEISLTATYTVNVYATATGYENSDVATATLCWLDAEPKTEGMTSDIATARGNAVLIQSHNGILNIAGVAKGTDIVVYSTSGQMVGSAKANGATLSVTTTLRNGNIAIVRIGDKSVKVVIQ